MCIQCFFPGETVSYLFFSAVTNPQQHEIYNKIILYYSSITIISQELLSSLCNWYFENTHIAFLFFCYTTISSLLFSAFSGHMWLVALSCFHVPLEQTFSWHSLDVVHINGSVAVKLWCNYCIKSSNIFPLVSSIFECKTSGTARFS